MKEKIGIVTELNLNDVNFGNHLQSYALNHYLNLQYPEKEVETLLLPRRHEARIYATVFWWFRITCKRCYAKLKGMIIPSNRGQKIDNRFEKFIQFARTHIRINDKYTRWEQVKASDYKIMIVGSDVVWQQSRGCIRKSRFLYFDYKQEPQNVVRIAYAASFGINFIPKENVKILKKSLSSFKAVSVREKSALELLESIGLKNAVHVCDPTLLLSRDQWIKIEKEPCFQGSTMNKKYCFAYLLGQDENQRKAITNFCKKEGLLLITIPYINGYIKSEFTSGPTGSFLDCFGDIQIMDCSPQKWIWLIHHAEYVITDSFHGLVFSTIFDIKFITLKRAWKFDMNVRLSDYLDLLGERDKYFEINEISDLDNLKNLTWDYEKIHKNMDAFILKSKDYLKKALSS